jgi:hypothetical protein
MGMARFFGADGVSTGPAAALPIDLAPGEVQILSPL